MSRLWLFLFLPLCLWSGEYFDCVVIGTSPIPLMEAIYQYYSGKSVLILEQGKECGGAWKSIDICGTHHVDMGCHELIGANALVREFLRTYLGCKIVSMKNPVDECTDCSSFYFSNGCYELIDHLEKIIERTGIVLRLNCPVERVAPESHGVRVETKEGEFFTSKVITIPNAFFQIEGFPRPKPSPFRFWHLYLLLQDPTLPRFSYLSRSFPGISRCMNLTHFAQLFGSGRQLIVFQVYDQNILQQTENILAELKKKEFVDPSAYVLQSEVYLYEQFPYDVKWLQWLPEPARSAFEILDTSAFGSIARYLPRWEMILKPYAEMLGQVNSSQ
jgi:phytoene dehydrogenase-like protein